LKNITYSKKGGQILVSNIVFTRESSYTAFSAS